MTTTDWLQEYYAAWDAGDLEQIATWFDDEVVLEDVPTGHLARGLTAARAFVEAALVKVHGATTGASAGDQPGLISPG